MSRTQRFIRITATVALLLATLDRSLAAQSLRGAVRDSASHQPIAGAVVMLLDSSGTVLGRNISDERGQYRIALTSAARSARVVRIGFQPRAIPLPSPADRTAPFDVSMVPVSTMLTAVRVQERSDCPHRRDDATTLGLWEQARAGLLATVVAREANPASMELLVFDRRLEHFSDRITHFSVDLRTADRADNSFIASFSAKAFVNSGFATDSDGTQLLFGPDADVLLDEAFATAYCFRLAEPSPARPRQVGLAFAPARLQRDRVDIDGTLWVDTAARALTDIEFRYIGMPRYSDSFKPGGRISFRQMPNGIVLVDRWQLRGVGPGKDTRPDAADSIKLKQLAPMEFGGELARATWPHGLTWHASLASVRIHAATSAGQAAAGTVIALRETHYRGTADANGDALIDDLLPGPYWLQIADPRLAELGIAMPTTTTFVAVRDSTFRTTVRVPTAEEYVTGRCVDAHQWTPGVSMLILGRVVTPGGAPVNNARVSYSIKQDLADWSAISEYYTTGSDGTFQECSRRLGFHSTVRIRVQQAKLTDVDTVVTLAAKLTVVRVQVPAAP